MVVVVIFFSVGGVTYLGRGYLAPLLAFVALGIIPLLVVVWIDNHTGMSSFLNHAWQLFSGVHDPGDIVATVCPDGSDSTQTEVGYWTIPFVLFFLIMPSVNMLIAGLAIVMAAGVPFAPLVGLASRSWEGIVGAGTYIATFLCVVAVAGGFMRLMHIISLAGC